MQPQWSPDNKLYYISDETGWGNIYVHENETSKPVLEEPSEFGRPLWSLGTKSYTIKPSGRIIASCFHQGELEIKSINPASGLSNLIPTSLRTFENIVTSGDNIYGICTTDYAPPAIVCLNESGEHSLIRSSTEMNLNKEDISVGKIHSIPSKENETIYGLYYPPTNSQFEGLDGAKPPLLMMAHGGPTGSADRGLKLKIQYWTSRGFAVFDLDYSGSTGYGRAYKERLDGKWGVRDVEDVETAAKYLVSQGLADPEALLITGGSAGGYTVLLALAELDIFAGGACHYGVADLLHLQACTHKFEGGYLYRLLGVEPPKPGEEMNKTAFVERSPVTKAHNINKPVIFFQGLEDKIVPPAQTRTMVAALKTQNTPVYAMEFEEEGHGFRKAETIKNVLNYEYIFYAKLLNLDLRDMSGNAEIEMM